MLRPFLVGVKKKIKKGKTSAILKFSPFLTSYIRGTRKQQKNGVVIPLSLRDYALDKDKETCIPS
jgi:hypothetical protein